MLKIREKIMKTLNKLTEKLWNSVAKVLVINKAEKALNLSFNILYKHCDGI